MPSIDAPQSPPLRETILDAARAMLLEDGYAGLSMRRIAARIGYSPTALYLHFAGKDAILHALIDEGMGRLGVVLRAAAEEPDARARLRALCAAYVRFGFDNPARYEVMFLLHPRHMERYPAERFRAARKNLDLFAVALVEAGADGALAAADSNVAASAVWAQLHGVVSLVLAGRLDARLDERAVVEAALAHVAGGLFAPLPDALSLPTP